MNTEKANSPQSSSIVELWMIRHGETIFNKKNIVQGWCDSPLTQNGIFMTACLGAGLKKMGIEFDAVYSSDLTRCLETAKILTRFMNSSLIIQPDIRLREINTGDGEGDNIENHLKKYPHSLNFKKHQGTPNGEKWSDVYSRIVPAIKEIVQNHKERNGKVLVVSHSMAIASIMGFIDKSIEEVVHIPNNSVTIIKHVDGALKFDAYGDEKYIKKGLLDSDNIKRSLDSNREYILQKCSLCY